MLRKELRRLGDHLSAVGNIRVQEHPDLACGGQHTGLHRVALALVGGVADDPGLGQGQGLHFGPAVVGGAVVHEDQLVVGKVRGQVFVVGMGSGLDDGRLVVHGDDQR